jgi:hypothetical protein
MRRSTPNFCLVPTKAVGGLRYRTGAAGTVVHLGYRPSSLNRCELTNVGRGSNITPSDIHFIKRRNHGFSRLTNSIEKILGSSPTSSDFRF